MAESILEKLFQHNNWANLKLIEYCSALSDAQLDVAPLATTEWSIRRVLAHIVESQQGYFGLLTQPAATTLPAVPSMSALVDAAAISGDGLLALAKGEADLQLMARIRTSDGYVLEPWTVMVLAINHATDHRRQICEMLKELGVAMPTLDGWSFGEATNSVIPNGS